MSGIDRLTRRETVRLGGAAAAGGVLGGLAGPLPAVAQPNGELAFDVRRLVPGAEHDPPHVQCVYDDVNRLVLLIGDIRFPRLFRARLGDLLPPLAPRVDHGAELGLFTDPQRIKDIGLELAELGGGITIGALYTRRRGQIPRRVRRLQLELWRHGIRVPLPASTARTARIRRQALRALIRFNRRMTFQSFFETPQERVSARGMQAIFIVKQFGLLAWSNNDRCCKKKGGRQKILDACIASTGHSCYLSNRSGTKGLCTAASDVCS